MHRLQPPPIATDYLFAVQKKDVHKINVCTLFSAVDDDVLAEL
jgi:hypothetical protein